MLKIGRGLIRGDDKIWRKTSPLACAQKAINHAELDGWDLKTGGLEGFQSTKTKVKLRTVRTLKTSFFFSRYLGRMLCDMSL